MRTIRIVTRRSHLALVQATMPIIPLLATRAGETQSEFSLQITGTDTSGDKGKSSEYRAITELKDQPKNEKSKWFAQVDAAIARDLGDIGVHSAKDVPPEIDPHTVLFPILGRDDPRDVFISRHGVSFANLPKGARLGTVSTRRRAQIKRLRPDITFADYRGNVPTRVSNQHMDKYGVDGVVLAAAGIDRLGKIIPDSVLERREYFSLDQILPCVNQAIVVAQCRKSDDQVVSLIKERLVQPDTMVTWLAERIALETMNADCSKPLAIHATQEGSLVRLQARAFSDDGSLTVVEDATGPIEDAENLGRSVGARMLKGISSKGLWDGLQTNSDLSS